MLDHGKTKARARWTLSISLCLIALFLYHLTMLWHPTLPALHGSGMQDDIRSFARHRTDTEEQVVDIARPPVRSSFESRQPLRPRDTADYQASLKNGLPMRCNLNNPNETTGDPSPFISQDALTSSDWICPQNDAAGGQAWASIQNLGPVLDALGLSKDPSSYTRSRCTHTSSGGFVENLFNLDDGTIVADGITSPVIGATMRWNFLTGNPPTGMGLSADDATAVSNATDPESGVQQPRLSAWSDITFLQWQTIASKSSQLHRVIEYNITTSTTQSTIDTILSNSGTSIDHLGPSGVSFDSESDEAAALLGSANGKGSFFLLWQHIAALGRKSLSSIHILSTNSDNGRAYHMLLEFETLTAGSGGNGGGNGGGCSSGTCSVCLGIGASLNSRDLLGSEVGEAGLDDYMASFLRARSSPVPTPAAILGKRQDAVPLNKLGVCSLTNSPPGISSSVEVPAYPGGYKIWSLESSRRLSASTTSVPRWYYISTNVQNCQVTMASVPWSQYPNTPSMSGLTTVLQPLPSDNANSPSMDHSWEKGWLKQFFASILDDTSPPVGQQGGGSGPISSINCADFDRYVFGIQQGRPAATNLLRDAFNDLPSNVYIADFIAMSQELNGLCKGWLLTSGNFAKQVPLALGQSVVGTGTIDNANDANDIMYDKVTYLAQLAMAVDIMNDASNLANMQRTNKRIYAQMQRIDTYAVQILGDQVVRQGRWSFAQAYKTFMSDLFQNPSKGITVLAARYGPRLIQSLQTDLTTVSNSPALAALLQQYPYDRVWTSIQTQFRGGLNARTDWTIQLQWDWS